MPASMITASVALRPNVTGSRIEMPESGPMPGSTPTSVPTRQPRNAYQRLPGSKATAKPCARLMSVLSTNEILEVELRQRRLEAVNEANVGDQNDCDAIARGVQGLSPFDHDEQGDHHRRHGGDEAEPSVE